MVKKKNQPKNNWKKPSKKQEVSYKKKKISSIKKKKEVSKEIEKNPSKKSWKKDFKNIEKELERQEEELAEMENTNLWEIDLEEPMKEVIFDPFRTVKYDDKYCSMMVSFFMRVKKKLSLIKTYHKPDHRLDWKDLAMLPTWEMVWPIKSVFPKTSIPVFPTFERFYTDIWLTEPEFYWRITVYSNFERTHTYCKCLQKAILLEWAMLWLYKEQFVQFLLKNNHWMKDESSVKVTDGRAKDPEEKTEEELMKELTEIRNKKDLSTKEEK